MRLASVCRRVLQGPCPVCWVGLRSSFLWSCWGAFHRAGHTASGDPPVGHFCTRNPVGYWSALHTSQPLSPIFKLDRIRFSGLVYVTITIVPLRYELHNCALYMVHVQVHGAVRCHNHQAHKLGSTYCPTLDLVSLSILFVVLQGPWPVC